MLLLLRRAPGQMAAPFIGLDQNLVRQHVELLLRLALDVAGPGIAQHAAQGALADRMRNRLARPGDDFDQQTQIRVDLIRTLRLDQKARQRHLFHENSR